MPQLARLQPSWSWAARKQWCDDPYFRQCKLLNQWVHAHGRHGALTLGSGLPQASHTCSQRSCPVNMLITSAAGTHLDYAPEQCCHSMHSDGGPCHPPQNPVLGRQHCGKQRVTCKQRHFGVTMTVHAPGSRLSMQGSRSVSAPSKAIVVRFTLVH